MTRVLLADDHPMIQAALEAMLAGTEYALVATAGTGSETLKLIGSENPEIVILDIQMPDGTGLDVLRALRSAGDDRPVVLLTASIEGSDFSEALSLSVDGVLLKSSDPALLIHCLDSVRAGEEWIDQNLERPSETGLQGERRVSLTPREFDLVRLVRQGLRNREIADRLGITEGTVKVYLHSVFEKTGVSNRTELAIRAAEWVGSDSRDI